MNKPFGLEYLEPTSTVSADNLYGGVTNCPVGCTCAKGSTCVSTITTTSDGTPIGASSSND